MADYFDSAAAAAAAGNSSENAVVAPVAAAAGDASMEDEIMVSLTSRCIHELRLTIFVVNVCKDDG